jgi:hypothetical protein
VDKTFTRLTLAAILFAGTASADILVLRGPNGQLYLTNRGEKSGYQVISRHREFYGSSGLGLRSFRGGDPSKYEEALSRLSTEYALDPHLVKAVIRAESNFDPMATSPKGAMGLMQLMPDTARQHRISNAYDPVENMTGGVRHLRYLMDRYDGQVDLVVAAYNAGTKPVDAVRGIPNYPETQEYVRRVREFHDRYQSELPTRTAAATPQPLTTTLTELNLAAKTPEEVYGVPIVLRGGGAAANAAAPKDH